MARRKGDSGNQYTLATNKPPSLTQFRQRVHIQKWGKPVEWLCEVLANGKTPEGEPVDVTKRIDIAMFLASKLVASPKPVLASPEDAAVDIAGELSRSSAVDWIRRLEQDGGGRVIDVELADDSDDVPE